MPSQWAPRAARDEARDEATREALCEELCEALYEELYEAPYEAQGADVGGDEDGDEGEGAGEDGTCLHEAHARLSVAEALSMTWRVRGGAEDSSRGVSSLVYPSVGYIPGLLQRGKISWATGSPRCTERTEGLEGLTAGRVSAGVFDVVAGHAGQDEARFVAAKARLAGEDVRAVLCLADLVVQLRQEQQHTPVTGIFMMRVRKLCRRMQVCSCMQLLCVDVLNVVRLYATVAITCSSSACTALRTTRALHLVAFLFGL